MMRPARVHVQRIQSLAGGDEQEVPFVAAKAEITGGFGELDNDDAIALGVENEDVGKTIA